MGVQGNQYVYLEDLLALEAVHPTSSVAVGPGKSFPVGVEVGAFIGVSRVVPRVPRHHPKHLKNIFINNDLIISLYS